MTVVYTSHYMEEVEALCSRVGILDHGKLVALDTVRGLTERYADGALEIEVAGDAAPATVALQRFGETTATGSRIRVHTKASPGEVVPALEAAGVVVLALERHRPDLETVFLSLTGRRLRDEP